MTVATMHRDPTNGGRVPRLPAFCRTARYWHQPRSAAMYGARLTVTYWCGAHNMDARPEHFASDPPEADRCGTCEGRRLGYERADGLIFTPRDHFADPTWCPGGTDLGGHCVSCHRVKRVRFSCRGYGGPDECRHHPEGGMRFEPCPNHGWSWVARIGDWRDAIGLRCNHWRCEYNNALPRREAQT